MPPRVFFRPSLHWCLLFLAFAPGIAWSQIRLVESGSAKDAVPLSGAYEQNFESLPDAGAAPWRDNATLPGWLANFTRGQVSQGKFVARAADTLGAVEVGATGTPASLNVLVAKSGGRRALGGTPGVYAPGKDGIFSSESVNLVLRLRNATASVLTGLRIGFDAVASSENRDAIAFAYRVFSAGAGAIDREFIETHRSLTPYNETFNDSMRTEYGRSPDRVTGWACVAKDVVPASRLLSERREYVFRDLAVPPGAEIWLAWHIAKEDERGLDDPVATSAIDNVRLDQFSVGRPGWPVIVAQPRPLEVGLEAGQVRGFRLAVSACGEGLAYQWRKDGAPIPGATAADYVVARADAASAGVYDVVVSSATGSETSLPTPVKVYALSQVSVEKDVDYAAPSSPIKGLAAAKNGTLCDLYGPVDASGPRPALVLVHGGGGNNGDKADAREVEASRELAARGWFVMSINYAMSSNSAACWPKNLWDAKQAVRWLRKNGREGAYSIDPERIGAIGFSWGCNLVSMLALTSPADDENVSDARLRVEPLPRGDAYDGVPADIRCAAAFYGANDLPNYHKMKQFHEASAWSDRNFYRRASPVAHVKRGGAPLLFVHGSADDDVWQSQTETTFHLLRSVGAHVEPYFQVPGGQHSFRLREDKRIEKGFAKPIDVRPETIGYLARFLESELRPPFILAHPASQGAAVGEQVVLKVDAQARPSPSFQWRKDGVALAGASEAELKLTVSPATKGYYDVVVSNSAGQLTSFAAYVAPAAP